MAHITDLGFTLDELLDAIDAGDVRVQTHPEFPELKIFNYSEEVQYRNKWNKITLACRGLILNAKTGDVIARPWEKFFNFGQMDNRIESTAPVEVTDKMDGSLGILYMTPDDQWAIATRGSFASEQAAHATEVLNRRYYDFLSGLNTYFPNGVDCTILFEIVYPANRIVVNYGDMDDIVLLGGVHKEYGHYFGPTEIKSVYGWSGPVTEVWKFDSFVDALSFPDREGKEGVVIRSGRNIVKLKQADYVELHRIVTNLSPKTIWEMMGEGKTVADICAGIPDEFHKYVEDIGNTLLEQASEIKYEALIDYNNVVMEAGKSDRRAFAQRAVKSKYRALLFQMFDERPVTHSIWKMVKPRGDVKSLVEDEG